MYKYPKCSCICIGFIHRHKRWWLLITKGSPAKHAPKYRYYQIQNEERRKCKWVSCHMLKDMLRNITEKWWSVCWWKENELSQADLGDFHFSLSFFSGELNIGWAWARFIPTMINPTSTPIKPSIFTLFQETKLVVQINAVQIDTTKFSWKRMQKNILKPILKS